MRVSGQRWSSRCSTCSRDAISSGVGTTPVADPESGGPEFVEFIAAQPTGW
ncbi:Uncharacterised protein [Mycobacterium tuberculosis]|uniref:Uncharacterized protein n=1 Tax=Mycobacterium tuberculosis TaxID=1773 RepID=A0A655IWR6_MYCTX|nr:Uncharacterised protein [Mycobacterium tuberculosis]COW53225.1 Uncharacterised protein [Mycobacterium tuberculosis]COW70371.1 Uncharacterised protein [Mycobacterium tuberculosis]COY46980.1 Uncharacterised protein [Mycobacterium tuberculosis]SGO27513.1 Uncharacterised protein [Mycobacterium tuberculosis]